MEGNNLSGFNIIIENETEPKAREMSEVKAKNLERILVIKSGMALEAYPTGSEGVPK